MLIQSPSNSAAIFAKVEIIERHNHSSESWYGKSAGDAYFDPTVLTEWRVTAGSSEAFGTALQISNGDEIESGDPKKYYELHEILVTAVSSTSKVYKVQFLYGTGAVGNALIGTEVVGFFPATGRAGPIKTRMPRITCNNKLWAKLACETNSATLDFIVGLHTYDV